MFGRAAVAVACLWLAILAPDSAATAQQGEGATVDVAAVDSNNYPNLTAAVNVLDARGRPLPGLAATDFAASIDGKQATIDSVQTAVDAQAGLAVVLAVDVSGDLTGEYLEAARLAARQFVNSLEPQDAVAVMAFSDTVSLIQDFSADRAATVAALDSLQAAGATAQAPYEAMDEAMAKATAAASSRRAIILLSDGVNRGGGSLVARNDSVIRAGLVGIPVYTIGVGDSIDRDYLGRLSQATGGRFLETPSAQGLSDMYSEIGSVLRSQYIVAINATDIAPAAALSLELKVNVQGVVVTATKQFAVPAAASLAVTLEGITNGQELGEPVTVLATVTGNIEKVEFAVDGKTLVVDRSAPFKATLDPDTLKQGEHELNVKAFGSAGKTASASSGFSVPVAAAPSGGGSGGSSLPLLAGLTVVVVAAVVFYILRLRRPQLRRRAVETRLRPWASAVPSDVSLWDAVDEEPPVAPDCEVVDSPLGELLLLRGSETIARFALGGNPVGIGCGDRCCVKLPDDEGRIGLEEARAWVHHGKLIYHRLTRLTLLASEGESGGWFILDDGDDIGVGSYRLRFTAARQGASEQAAINQALNDAAQNFSSRSMKAAAGGGSRLWSAVPPLQPQPVVDDNGSQPTIDDGDTGDDSSVTPHLWIVPRISGGSDSAEASEVPQELQEAAPCDSSEPDAAACDPLWFGGSAGDSDRDPAPNSDNDEYGSS